MNKCVWCEAEVSGESSVKVIEDLERCKVEWFCCSEECGLFFKEYLNDEEGGL